jgi:shikimate kinase
MPVSKVAVIASASGNGKTTLGREIAQRLRVPFIEMDALVHGPGWVEISNDELRARSSRSLRPTAG